MRPLGFRRRHSDGTGCHRHLQCYVHTDENGAVLAETAQAGSISDEPVTSGISTVSNGVTIWNYGPDGGGAIALAYGRAAPSVTSVRVTTSDGRVITATVQGGWWAMWAPGDTPLPRQRTSATPTAPAPPRRFANRTRQAFRILALTRPGLLKRCEALAAAAGRAGGNQPTPANLQEKP